MADQARITSVDALESFRASLVVYLSKASPALEEISDVINRTRAWLQDDQRMHWEGQVRQRRKALEQAQAALHSARMSTLRDSITTEQMAVNRAKRLLEEAEEKLRRVKQWNREFDNVVGPSLRKLESLRAILTNDMPQAVAYLAHVVKTLDAYTGIAPPAAADPFQQNIQNTEGKIAVKPNGGFGSSAPSGIMRDLPATQSGVFPVDTGFAMTTRSARLMYGSWTIFFASSFSKKDGLWSAGACSRFALQGACPRLPLLGRGKPLSFKAVASHRTPKSGFA